MDQRVHHALAAQKKVSYLNLQNFKRKFHEALLEITLFYDNEWNVQSQHRFIGIDFEGRRKPGDLFDSLKALLITNFTRSVNFDSGR